MFKINNAELFCIGANFNMATLKMILLYFNP